MSVTTKVGPGDFRRALAALTHHASGDVRGLHAALVEATEAHRQLELVLALLSATVQMHPEMSSEDGLAELRRHLLDAAAAEASESSTP